MFYKNFNFIDNNKNILGNYKLKHNVNIIK